MLSMLVIYSLLIGGIYVGQDIVDRKRASKKKVKKN